MGDKAPSEIAGRVKALKSDSAAPHFIQRNGLFANHDSFSRSRSEGTRANYSPAELRSISVRVVAVALHRILQRDATHPDCSVVLTANTNLRHKPPAGYFLARVPGFLAAMNCSALHTIAERAPWMGWPTRKQHNRPLVSYAGHSFEQSCAPQ